MRTNLNYYYNKKILDTLVRFILTNQDSSLSYFDYLTKIYPDILVNEEDSDVTYSKMKENEFLETFKNSHTEQLPRIIKWKGPEEDANYILSVGEILFLNNPYYESIIIDELSDFVYGEELDDVFSKPAFFNYMIFGQSLTGTNTDVYAKFRKVLAGGKYQWAIKIYNAYTLSDKICSQYEKITDGYELQEDDYIIVFKSDPNVYIVHGEDALNSLGWGI